MPDEILSPEEIDALLQEIGEVEGETVEQQAAEEAEEKEVKPYDFRRPDRFNREQVRTIYMLHETFGRLWSGRLSNWLRSLVSMSVLSVDQLTYSEYLQSIPNPSILSLLSLEPLEGRALIEFSPQIAFPVIDRLLGGSGRSEVEDRELTDIEERIISNIVEESLVFLREAWEGMIELEPALVNLESNPLFVQLVPPNDMILQISIEANIQSFSGLINIVYPYVLLEPVLDKLSAQRLYSTTAPGHSPESQEQVSEALGRAPAPVSVRAGTAALTFGEIIDLEEGDVIRLDSEVEDDLPIYVNDKLKFYGRPGLYRGRKAAQVTREITEEEIEEMSA